MKTLDALFKDFEVENKLQSQLFGARAMQPTGDSTLDMTGAMSNPDWIDDWVADDSGAPQISTMFIDGTPVPADADIFRCAPVA